MLHCDFIIPPPHETDSDLDQDRNSLTTLMEYLHFLPPMKGRAVPTRGNETDAEATFASFFYHVNNHLPDGNLLRVDE